MMDDIIKALPWLLARGWALVRISTAMRPLVNPLPTWADDGARGGNQPPQGAHVLTFVGLIESTAGLELTLWWSPLDGGLGWILCREQSEVTRAAVDSPTAPSGRLGELLDGLDQEVAMAWCRDDDGEDG